MKYMFFLSVLFLFTSSLQSQIVVNSNISSFLNSTNSVLPFAGAPLISSSKYIDLKEGSQFFQDSWAKAKIVAEDGRVFRDVSIKLNLFENKVHYIDVSGQELIVTTPLKEIELQQSNNSTAHFINGTILPNQKQGWYLLLVNDSLSLLKEIKKAIEEHTSYGSPKEYSIKTHNNYFLYLGTQEFQIKKPADLIKVFPLKKNIIEEQTKKLNNKLDKDEQLSMLAIYFNSLLKTNSK